MPMPEGGMGPVNRPSMLDFSGPTPLPPPQRPNRPIPSPQMNDYEGSVMRESELNRDNPYDNPEFRAKIARENPYNDANFNRPGGLGDQMRGKAYQDNDNMMDDVLMMEEMRKRPKGAGVTRELPADWRDLDTTEPYRIRDKRLDFDTTPRPRPEPGRGWGGDFDRDTNPALELQSARKKGITPVPWNRRNRAL